MKDGDMKTKMKTQIKVNGNTAIIKMAMHVILCHYDTVVCSIRLGDEPKFYRHWDGYSKTTLLLVNQLRVDHGLVALKKADWQALPVCEGIDTRITRAEHIKKIAEGYLISLHTVCSNDIRDFGSATPQVLSLIGVFKELVTSPEDMLTEDWEILLEEATEAIWM